jgi:hypothetical protein
MDVMRRAVLLKKHHPVFAQRDQDILSFPFLKKRFTDVFKIGVIYRSFVCVTAGDSRRKKRFGPIWFDNCDAASVDGVSRVGISGYDLTSGRRVPSDLSD